LKFDIYRYYPAESAANQLLVISNNTLSRPNDNDTGKLAERLILYIAKGGIIKISYNTRVYFIVWKI